MKKLLFVFAFIGFAGLTAQAQCPHSMAKAQTEEASTTEPAEAAVLAASLDQTIVSRTCPTTGKVSYVRKVVNSESGAVSFEDVEYCTTRGRFVSLEESDAPAEKACTAKGAESKGAGCCSSATAGAKAASSGCCSGASAGESSCAGKKKGGA